ncbi:MAG TPA: hypothetical protein VFF06_24500 [Polyangia bacterium]|nr:hypothetical protein [Polyangia bacterium]
MPRKEWLELSDWQTSTNLKKDLGIANDDGEWREQRRQLVLLRTHPEGLKPRAV